jgi:hypothetical protein
MFAVFAVIIIPTALLNGLIILTIWRKPCLQKPSNIFLCNLAISDFVVAVVAVPASTMLKAMELRGDNAKTVCIFGYSVGAVASAFSALSLFTITAATVDRFLAIHLHLRYATVMTTRRVITTCIGLWLAAVFVPLSAFVGLTAYRTTLLASSVACIVVMAYCYCKILQVVRHHHNQIQSQQQANPEVSSFPNINSFKKSVMNLMYVLGLYIILYLPFISLTIIRERVGDSPTILHLWNIAVALVFLHSAINPMLYCWRLREIREQVKETVTNCLSKIVSCFQNA